MIIKSLSLQNFIGYRQKVSINFDGKRVIGISGSNQAGKSTILRAIGYVMFGKSHAKQEIQLINTGGRGTMLVEGAIELPSGEVLEITRGRTRQNEPIVKLAGYDGKPSDISKIIEEKIGVDYKDFLALSYFVQGDIHQFLSGNKREYFARWTESLSLWQDFEKEAKTEQAGVERDLQAERLRLVRLQDMVSDEDELQSQLSIARERLEDRRKRVEKASKEVNRTQASISKLEAVKEAANGFNGIRLQLGQVRQTVSRTRAEVDRLIQRMAQVKGGECPLLSIPCNNLFLDSEKQRKDMQREKAAIEQDLLEYKQAEANLATQLKTLQEQTSDDRYDRLQNELRASFAEQREAQQDEQRVAVFIQHKEDALADIQKAKVDIEKAKVYISRLEQEVQHWSYVKYMCGKSGIPLKIISQELQVVEDKCNWVLERLGYDKKIKFSAQRTLSGYEKVCPVCGNEVWQNMACVTCGRQRPRKVQDEPTVTILDGDVERPFEMESGGAQVLHSFAARLACSLFVSSMTGIPVKLAMLDETFAMLDTENRQKLLALVVGKLSTVFNIRQQFIVSHQDDITHAVDHMLVVTKERGSSMARWA